MLSSGGTGRLNLTGSRAVVRLFRLLFVDCAGGRRQPRPPPTTASWAPRRRASRPSTASYLRRRARKRALNVREQLLHALLVYVRPTPSSLCSVRALQSACTLTTGDDACDAAIFRSVEAGMRPRSRDRLVPLPFPPPPTLLMYPSMGKKAHDGHSPTGHQRRSPPHPDLSLPPFSPTRPLTKLTQR